MAKSIHPKKKAAKKALMTFSSHEISLFAKFYVEESKNGNSWKRIPHGAGPYSSDQEAMGVAQAYSLANHVMTRVVGVD